MNATAEFERLTTLKSKGPIRALVPSPDGSRLVVIHGTPHRDRVDGATLYQRSPTGYTRTGELAGTPTMLALDDGAVIAVESDYREVELIRHGPDGRREATFIACQGISLQEVHVLLDADGAHALVWAIDRDDGQRWSQPSASCVRVDLRTGATAAAPRPSTGRQAPFDLSADQRLVVGLGANRELEVRDRESAALRARLDPKHQVRCSVFLATGEVVAGTEAGLVLLLGLPRA